MPVRRLEASNPATEERISGDESSGEALEYPTGSRFWLIILTMSALLVLGGLDTNIIATAVPSITDHFHTTADIGWYSSAFRLCSCAFQFIFGKLYKLFSIKRIFLLAQAIFLLGSILSSTATTSSMFIVGRAITGAGFSGIIGGLFTILVYILPLRRRPFYCGMLAIAENAAALSAPIIGGLLTQSLNWRWCFYLSLPICITTLLMTTFLFTDPKPSDQTIPLPQKLRQLDPLSNLLFIPALTTLFLALSYAGSKYPWSSPQVLTALLTSLTLTTVFAYNQHRRGDSAALPPRILKTRTVLSASLFTLTSNSATNILEYYLPTYYQTVHSFPPSSAGYMMTPLIIGATLGMALCGSGTSLVGYYTPFMLVSSILMPIFAGLITTFNPATNLARHILFPAGFGFACGVGFNAPVSAVQTALPTEDIPLGLAVVLLAQQFGPAVFVAVAQVIFSRRFEAGLAELGLDLDNAGVEGRGLLEIIQGAPAEVKGEVLESVREAFGKTWYLAVAVAGVSLVGSLGVGWRSVKEKNA
ncbi:major facilitator superfamily transporter [Aspergillus karnatakaensis]|uniref:major facilitator superfamily transporter n=1 Tax=Aspergillus karnatakaensis TaxID=1810916 RepID=UPI003CCD0844